MAKCHDITKYLGFDMNEDKARVDGGQTPWKNMLDPFDDFKLIVTQSDSRFIALGSINFIHQHLTTQNLLQAHSMQSAGSDPIDIPHTLLCQTTITH